MEVVSTSNLVSLQTEKTKIACNFHHDYAMTGQIGSYIYKYEEIRGFMIAEM